MYFIMRVMNLRSIDVIAMRLWFDMHLWQTALYPKTFKCCCHHAGDEPALN
jgi:hypothetical protein